MSEANVPPRPQDADSLPDAQGQLPLESANPPTGDDDWEIVPLVGMLPLNSPDPGEPSSALPPLAKTKEGELQSRIVDLNHCNEVLLARVHQLEDALERSQQALQQEVERSQHRPAADKVAVAQSQSVAQLLSELDAANAALKRQTLLAETLTTQLKSAEERAERLEKECAILRKRKSERAKQLQTAEETCTDLRSRLQRQQQYTLQFKAALEKCLDTSAFQHTSQSIESDAVPTPGAIASASVTPSPSIGMPRSESIRPWSANPAQMPADPQLQSLLRSPPTPAEPLPPRVSEASNRSPSAVTGSDPRPTTEATPSQSPTPASSDALTDQPHHEAEQQLWQDVERVVKNTTASSDTTALPNAPAPSDAPPAPAKGTAAPPPTAADTTPPPDLAETAEFTEPIPWGAPIKAEPPAIAEAPASVEPAATFPDPVPATAEAEPVTPPPAPASPPKSPPPAYAASIPALDAMQTAQKSPSPLVHPLRPPQRKRKSLSAVELPSFPPLPKVQNH